MHSAFHNTTGLRKEELNQAEAQAETQVDKIIEFFRQNPSDYFTPCEVHKTCFSSFTPITSIRRAITGLEHAGVLLKTTYKRKGSYGKINFCWCLNPCVQEQKELF